MDTGGSRWEGRAAASSGREEVKGRPRSDWRPPWWPGRSGSGAAATAIMERKKSDLFKISYNEKPFFATVYPKGRYIKRKFHIHKNLSSAYEKKCYN
jgi:hypothetical protein